MGRADARLWKQLRDIVDGNEAALAAGADWMPSHRSASEIREVRLASGRRISAAVWRANRLVDALAVIAAANKPRLAVAGDFVRIARNTAKLALATLGAVTHAANNHVVTTI